MVSDPSGFPQDASVVLTLSITGALAAFTVTGKLSVHPAASSTQMT